MRSAWTPRTAEGVGFRKTGSDWLGEEKKPAAEAGDPETAPWSAAGAHLLFLERAGSLSCWLWRALLPCRQLGGRGGEGIGGSEGKGECGGDKPGPLAVNAQLTAVPWPPTGPLRGGPCLIKLPNSRGDRLLEEDRVETMADPKDCLSSPKLTSW